MFHTPYTVILPDQRRCDTKSSTAKQRSSPSWVTRLNYSTSTVRRPPAPNWSPNTPLSWGTEGLQEVVRDMRLLRRNKVIPVALSLLYKETQQKRYKSVKRTQIKPPYHLVLPATTTASAPCSPSLCSNATLSPFHRKPLQLPTPVSLSPSVQQRVTFASCLVVRPGSS